MTTQWTFDEAVIEVRRIGIVTACGGWYASIGGSVLHKGYSDHDLDIIFIPHCHARIEDLHEALLLAGLTLVRDAETVRAGWEYPDVKHVEEWKTVNGKRIDAIVMRTIFS